MRNYYANTRNKLETMRCNELMNLRFPQDQLGDLPRSLSVSLSLSLSLPFADCFVCMKCWLPRTAGWHKLDTFTSKGIIDPSALGSLGDCGRALYSEHPRKGTDTCGYKVDLMNLNLDEISPKFCTTIPFNPFNPASSCFGLAKHTPLLLWEGGEGSSQQPDCALNRTHTPHDHEQKTTG